MESVYQEGRWRRLNVSLNGNLLEKIECLSVLRLHIAVDGGIHGGEVKFRMNNVEKVYGGSK